MSAARHLHSIEPGQELGPPLPVLSLVPRATVGPARDPLLNRVLAVATTHRERVIVLLAGVERLTSGEIARARVTDLHDGGAVLEVRSRVRGRPDAVPTRAVRLDDRTREAIGSLIASQRGRALGALVGRVAEPALPLVADVVRMLLVELIDAAGVSRSEWAASRLQRQVGGYIDDHTEWMGMRNLRPSTIYQRRRVLARLTVFLDLDPLEASAEDLTAFVSRPMTPESRATEISHLRSFYQWAHGRKLIDDNPAEHLLRPRLQRRLPRPMEPGDLVAAIAAAPEPVRLWIHLAAFAGLRCIEIARLRRDEILDRYDPPVLIVLDGKGGKQRVVPLARELIAAVHSAGIPPGGWIAARADGAGPYEASRVSQLGNRHLRACGIGATMHQARHLFGTEMYRRTQDLRIVQELLGHSSPATTAGYAAWSPAAAAEAVEDLTYTAD